MVVTENNNPGEQLREILKSLYPITQNNEQNEKSSFVFNIDYAFKADGKLSQLLYDSSINYLVRRLIYSSAYIKKKYQSDNYPPERFINELRKFVEQETRIEETEIEKIIILLQQCLQAKNKNRKSSSKRLQKKRIIENMINTYGELRCYVCGKSLAESDDNKENQIEIEHYWPQSLGGLTQDFNLKVSCSSCNNYKKSYIDFSDFHYEQICLINNKDDIYASHEIEKEKKIAIWAKNEYSCSVCSKKAAEIGTLSFGRINLNDSWHFLNIESYCDMHNPEKYE